MIDLRVLSFFFLLKVSVVSCLFGGYHFVPHTPSSTSTLAIIRRSVLSACLTTTPLITVTNATDSPNDPNEHGSSSVATPIRNNFGDIMSAFETSVVLPGNYTAMERVILTANGNLQRILSAYYGAPVKVEMRKCVRVDAESFDREVDLVLGNKIICSIVGKIVVKDRECLHAIEAGLVGVGQLFRYLNILPSFKLNASGKAPQSIPRSPLMKGRKDGKMPIDYHLWRDYELSCPKISCHFIECFAPGFLDDSFLQQALAQPTLSSSFEK